MTKERMSNRPTGLLIRQANKIQMTQKFTTNCPRAIDKELDSRAPQLDEYKQDFELYFNSSGDLYGQEITSEVVGYDEQGAIWL